MIIVGIFAMHGIIMHDLAEIEGYLSVWANLLQFCFGVLLRGNLHKISYTEYIRSSMIVVAYIGLRRHFAGD